MARACSLPRPCTPPDSKDEPARKRSAGGSSAVHASEGGSSGGPALVSGARVGGRAMARQGATRSAAAARGSSQPSRQRQIRDLLGTQVPPRAVVPSGEVRRTVAPPGAHGRSEALRSVSAGRGRRNRRGEMRGSWLLRCRSSRARPWGGGLVRQRRLWHWVVSLLAAQRARPVSSPAPRRLRMRSAPWRLRWSGFSLESTPMPRR